MHISALVSLLLLSLMGSKHHFVLVHGACHGAWCWYKLETVLNAAGHQVTSLDMAASGVDPKSVDDLKSIRDYFEPLTKFMESLPNEEKVILVGHSFSGFGISIAMEKFPEKISVAVFLTAAMFPHLFNFSNLEKEDRLGIHSYLSEFLTGGSDEMDSDYSNNPNKARLFDSDQMDNVFGYANGPDKPATSVLYGPKYLAANAYNLSPPEDLTVATKSVRPFCLFSKLDAMKEILITLTSGNYGSVKRAFVKTDQDKMDKPLMQSIMLKLAPPDIVKEIVGSDHMVMMSKTFQLFSCLVDIADSLS